MRQSVLVLAINVVFMCSSSHIKPCSGNQVSIFSSQERQPCQILRVIHKSTAENGFSSRWSCQDNSLLQGEIWRTEALRSRVGGGPKQSTRVWDPRLFLLQFCVREKNSIKASNLKNELKVANWMYGLLDWQADRHSKLLTQTVTHFYTEEGNTPKTERNLGKTKEKVRKMFLIQIFAGKVSFLCNVVILFFLFFPHSSFDSAFPRMK